MHVGFVGLGIMGSRMAAKLRRAGFELTVFNRPRDKAERWADEHGGSVAGSPAEVAAAADALVTMVVDGPQVERVCSGPRESPREAATDSCAWTARRSRRGRRARSASGSPSTASRWSTPRSPAPP